MKKLLFVALLSLVGWSCSHAQNVVNLKNGSIIRGELIEYIPGEKTTIKTGDGSIFVFADEEVASVARDENNATPTSNARGVNEKSIAPRGYRGFVEFSPFTFTVNGLNLKLNTTHGYQFNHNIFVGGGTGVLLNYSNNHFALPVFASLKGNVGKSLVQFTYGVSYGWGIGRYEDTDEYVDDNGYYVVETALHTGGFFYSSYNLGMRFGISPNFAMRLTSDLDFYLGSYLNGYWTLGIGFEF